MSVIAGTGAPIYAAGFEGEDVSGVDIFIYGDVWGNDGAINLISTDSGLEKNSKIFVGKSSTLSALQGPTVHIEADSSTVTNAGEITAVNGNAVQLWGNQTLLFNSGTIALLSDSENTLLLQGNEAKIVNTGTIQGDGIEATILFEARNPTPDISNEYAGSLDNSGNVLSGGLALQGSVGSDLITNSGTISGDIKLGGGAGGDALTNSGFIDGRVTGFGSGGGTVKNSGTITEELITGKGFDLVVNTGKLNYVDLGGSDDRYIALGDGYVSSRVDGGAGNDRLTGGKFAEVFNGDQGNDTLRGKGGEDTLTGGAGNDSLFGGVGEDDLDGGDGKDRLWGNRGDDVLVGGSKNDKLFGNADDDTLKGGAGADALWGGRGEDALFGGGGDDEFHFRGDSGNDSIFDFKRGADKIILHDLGIEGFADLSSALTIGGGGAVIDLTEFGNDARIYVANVETLTSSDFGFG